MTTTTPPEAAEQGDECATVTSIGAKGGETICPGTLESYLDVHGSIPGCSCHISPPCSACVEAPLVCNVCKVTVP
jgi:hypothetical protein